MNYQMLVDIFTLFYIVYAELRYRKNLNNVWDRFVGYIKTKQLFITYDHPMKEDHLKTDLGRGNDNNKKKQITEFRSNCSYEEEEEKE